jgi:hypothetical protein
MKTKYRGRLLGGLAVVALQFLVAGTALAHHPEISAVAVCDENNALVIEYTATAWLPVAGNIIAKRTNPDIAILFNSTEVASGAFASPTFSFSGSEAAPAGTSAVVTARADGAWGDGDAGGQSSSVTVTYPTEPCTGPTLGRFTGGGKQIRLSDGLKITRGLTIHCDLLLSNNLEVNGRRVTGTCWGHLETVECRMTGIQRPPPAIIR